MPNIRDRRSDTQCCTHSTWIGGTDSFLSGWGEAENGASIAVWACKPEHADTVEEWVNNRSDMLDVFRMEEHDIDESFAEAAHISIYVVHNNHPSLGETT